MFCGMLKVETSMIITSFQYNLGELIESNLNFKGAYHLSELAGVVRSEMGFASSEIWDNWF